jgi:CheY-like chemotaxis protein
MGHLVMIVEDDPDNLDSIVDLLVEEGYEVMAARSGKDAQEQLKAKQPCLVIADYFLPDMTGGDLLRDLRNHERDHSVPLVILTAASQPMLDPVDAPVLTKPVTLDDLLGVLRQYCDKPCTPGPVPLAR